VDLPRRRSRSVPELEERDLEFVPQVVLGALLALFDQLEALRPLLHEEQSTRSAIEQVREGRNQLEEERFGGRAVHPSFARRHRDLG